MTDRLNISVLKKPENMRKRCQYTTKIAVRTNISLIVR